jgi:hypothetical protein
MDEVCAGFRRPVACAEERMRATVFDRFEKIPERCEARLLALPGPRQCGGASLLRALPYPEEERELWPMESVLVDLAMIQFRRGNRFVRRKEREAAGA